MKTFQISLNGSDPSQVYIQQRKYANGRTRLELIDSIDNFPYATATVNLPDVLLEDNEILVKDYSENEGMLDFLTANNIVIPTERGVQSGFVWIPVCILRPESEWGYDDKDYLDYVIEKHNKEQEGLDAVMSQYDPS